MNSPPRPNVLHRFSRSSRWILVIEIRFDRPPLRFSNVVCRAGCQATAAHHQRGHAIGSSRSFAFCLSFFFSLGLFLFTQSAISVSHDSLRTSQPSQRHNQRRNTLFFLLLSLLIVDQTAHGRADAHRFGVRFARLLRTDLFCFPFSQTDFGRQANGVILLFAGACLGVDAVRFF